MENKFIAYSFEDCELEYFKTFEDAEKWLKDIYSEYCDTDGFSMSTCNGGDFIAEIKAVSKYIETDKKENYKKGEWPHGSQFDTIGKIEFKNIKD